MLWDLFLMKKLIKSVICGSVNSAYVHCSLQKVTAKSTIAVTVYWTVTAILPQKKKKKKTNRNATQTQKAESKPSPNFYVLVGGPFIAWKRGFWKLLYPLKGNKQFAGKSYSKPLLLSHSMLSDECEGKYIWVFLSFERLPRASVVPSGWLWLFIILALSSHAPGIHLIDGTSIQIRANAGPITFPHHYQLSQEPRRRIVNYYSRWDQSTYWITLATCQTGCLLLLMP